MAISLTPSAAQRVRNYLEKRGSGVGLRLGVTQTGCSGYSYVINYAEEIDPADIVFEDKGVKVIVDREASASEIPTRRANAAAAKASTSDYTVVELRVYIHSPVAIDGR